MPRRDVGGGEDVEVLALKCGGGDHVEMDGDGG